MMSYMCRPEKTHPVRNAVGPVTAQIKNHITRQKGPPTKFHSPRNHVISHDEYRKHDGFQCYSNGYVSDSNKNRPDRFFLVVTMSTLITRYQVFNSHEK